MTDFRLDYMKKTRTRSAGTPLFIGAAIAGLLHAAPSFYWMCGGMWLLDTVLVLIGWGGRGTFAGWQRVVTGQASLSNPLIAGHTYLWSPLFLIWGLLLCGALFVSRARRQKVPSTG